LKKLSQTINIQKMNANYNESLPSIKNQFANNTIDDILNEAMLLYSLQHVVKITQLPQAEIMASLNKALRICYLAGVNSRHHFKQIFLYDLTKGIVQIDWMLSKTGLNLVIIQIASADEKMAVWLWKLAGNTGV